MNQEVRIFASYGNSHGIYSTLIGKFSSNRLRMERERGEGKEKKEESSGAKVCGCRRRQWLIQSLEYS